MKKVILLTSVIAMTSVANAQTEYYFSTKMGIGDTDIYVDNDTKFSDYLVREVEKETGLTGFEYDASGLILDGFILD